MSGQKTKTISRSGNVKVIIKGLKKGKACYIKYRAYKIFRGKKYEGVINSKKVAAK